MIWRTQRCMHPHTFLRTRFRNVLRKWYQNKESKVFIFTSKRQKLRSLLAKKQKQSNFTHLPNRPNLRSLLAKQNDKGLLCRRRTGEAPRAEKFGDLTTADHKVLNGEGESRNNHRDAVVVQDLATQRIQSYPCKTKTSQETEKSSREFLEPSQKPEVIKNDNS